MKILIVTNMFPTDQNPTYGIFIKEQADSLKALGVRTDILFIEGYRRKWNYLKSIFTLYGKIISTHYDLIHCHYGLSGWVGRMQCLLPMVVTFHGDDILGTPGPNGKYTLTSRILTGLNKVLARLSDAVIVQSGQMRRKSGCPKTAIIPCGVDFNIFHPIDRTSACSQLGLDHRNQYILFPADPAIPVKNFPLAKESFDIIKSRFPNAQLITLAQKKSRPDIALYMNACNVLLFTSWHEGAGLVVKEAMACNLPVVSVNVGDVQEVISGVNNCYLVSRSTQEIADKVIAILDSKVRSSSAVRLQSLQPTIPGSPYGPLKLPHYNGRESVRRYELSNIAAKIMALYQNL